MTIILLSVALAILCNICYMDYKQRKANKRLNDIYNRRRAKEDRRRRLIKEKPDNVIFQTELIEAENPLHFVGRLESLKGVRGDDGDFALVGDIEYYYKDGKWYELVNDMPDSRLINK